MILSIILIAIGWGMFFLSAKTFPYHGNENDKDYKENKSTARWLILLGFILHVIAIAIAPESW